MKTLFLWVLLLPAPLHSVKNFLACMPQLAGSWPTCLVRGGTDGVVDGLGDLGGGLTRLQHTHEGAKHTGTRNK